MKSLLTLLFAIALIYAYSQRTPHEMLPYIMRGINIGNTLEPPQEGQWPEDAPIEWSDNGPAEEYYFDDIKDAGFQCVRLPITWHTHVLDTAPYTIDPEWLARVDEIATWVLKRKMHVIINAHHESWIKENYSNDIYKARFDSIWSQISEYFKDKPDSMMFEILNEPHDKITNDQNNELNARILQIIRKSNPSRIVMFSGKGWANVDDMINAELPADDYIMCYYHSYDPWTFAGLGSGTWGASSDIVAMQNRMQKAALWSQQNNIPVIISEFGTDTLCDYNSRMKFISQYVEEALKRNLAWSVWDDGGTFQVYRRNSRKWHDTKDILINFSEHCPNNVRLTDDNHTISINWDNRMTNADSIVIQRRESSTEFKRIAMVEPNVSAYSESVLPEEFYYYRVIAYRNDSVFPSCPQRILDVPSESERKPFYGTPIAIPGTVEAEDFDIGGLGLAYFNSDFASTENTYRDDKGADIEKVNDAFTLINNNKDEWYEYSISIAEAGSYNMAFHYSAITSGTVKVSIAGKFAKIALKKTNGIDQFVDTVRGLAELPAGEQILKLEVLKAGEFTIDKMSFTKYSLSQIKGSGGQGLQLLLQPNPAIDVCRLSATNCQTGCVEVFNSLGVKIVSVNTSLPYNLNTSDFKKGVYTVRVKNSEGLRSSKLVVGY